MTHDELLAKIDEEGEFLVQHFDSKTKVHSAFRAVVELHKPKDEGDGYFTCSCCFRVVTKDGGYIYAKYPCTTIRAIEKELE